MSKWLVGSSKIKRFACFNNISVSTTRPFSPPESKEISLKTSSPLKLNKAEVVANLSIRHLRKIITNFIKNSFIHC